MFSRVHSCGLCGLEGSLAEIECDLANGLPAFELVGLADPSVREARERVRAAIRNSGHKFPMQRIVVNLAPADTKKEGSGFDLPIAVAILASAGHIPTNPLERIVFSGELALDGSLRPVHGMISRVMAARKSGFACMIVPSGNVAEASVVEGIDIMGVENLHQLCRWLSEGIPLQQPIVSLEQRSTTSTISCFSDVRGQQAAKRALEVAASGGHHLIMTGSPGTGKSMLASRLPGILPDLSFEESLEITRIYSVAGLLEPGTRLVSSRPFRHPHHTISANSLAGGGMRPKPGEVSLAHHGVLFLDEMPEFGSRTLDVLRQPLEEGTVTISRVQATVTYPCQFMLVAAANPCKCGFYGDPQRVCTCLPRDAERYLARLSGPLMDRIDLHVRVPALSWDDMQRREETETSITIRNRVNCARDIQRNRYKGIGIHSNAQLSAADVRQYCQLDAEGRSLLRMAFERMGLSARSHDRILRMARTIADMEDSLQIRSGHVAEALQYRPPDRMEVDGNSGGSNGGRSLSLHPEVSGLLKGEKI